MGSESESEDFYEKNINNLKESTSWQERAQSARRLGDSKSEKAIYPLINALNTETDEVVLNRIIEALGKIKSKEATFPIIKILKRELRKNEEEQDKTRLFLLIESLMKIGDKRALEHLGLLLDSCVAEIKNLTEKALKCIDPNWKTNIK
ncbi:MAG: hypothetical protein GF383_03030 [Candidatus Lokiarchaeota archaeon]|nr:hypothetical protein [Candidatus Lokiarchaeota archaeon]MBD3338513.1 hypothetical protein [Candidatus Lokiarchaeota archaeon]